MRTEFLLATHGPFYRWFFPQRHRVIVEFVQHSREGWNAWMNRGLGKCDTNRNGPPPNSYQVLLNAQADRLSPTAFLDVCARICDEILPADVLRGLQPVPFQLDPNPLHPVLNDRDELAFLRHVRKYQLEISPLYHAAFEAGLFNLKLGPEFYERKLPKTDSAARPGHN